MKLNFTLGDVSELVRIEYTDRTQLNSEFYEHNRRHYMVLVKERDTKVKSYSIR